MLDWFDYHGHVCLSFELLAVSTFDFMKQNHYLPYPISQVRHMAYQICLAVNCEHTRVFPACVCHHVSDDVMIMFCFVYTVLHNIKLTHTDLKPENILFVNPEFTVTYNSEKVRRWASFQHRGSQVYFYRSLFNFKYNQVLLFVCLIIQMFCGLLLCIEQSVAYSTCCEVAVLLCVRRETSDVSGTQPWGWWTSAVPRLTTSITAPLFPPDTTERRRSFWVTQLSCVRVFMKCFCSMCDCFHCVCVCVELGWSQPCDVWSIGCILFEYYSGYTLFQVCVSPAALTWISKHHSQCCVIR